MGILDDISNLKVDNDAKSILLLLVGQLNAAEREIETLKTKLISTTEVCELLGCGRKKLWTIAKNDNFPKAVVLGRANHYKLSEIVAFRDTYGLAH